MAGISALMFRPRPLGYHIVENNPVCQRSIALTLSIPGVWRLLIVGGGGGGGSGIHISSYANTGEGGEAGAVDLPPLHVRTRSDTTYSIGQKGLAAVSSGNSSSGTPTTVFGKSAAGGRGGENATTLTEYTGEGGLGSSASTAAGSSNLREWQIFVGTLGTSPRPLPTGRGSPFGAGGEGGSIIPHKDQTDGTDGAILCLALTG